MKDILLIIAIVFFLNMGLSAQIGGGVDHTAFLSKGYVFTLGRSKYGQLGQGFIDYAQYPTRIPLNFTVALIDLKKSHTILVTSTPLLCCLLPADNEVYGMGKNSNGQLGIGNFDNQLSPELIPSSYFNNEQIQKVCTGSVHSAVLTSN